MKRCTMYHEEKPFDSALLARLESLITAPMDSAKPEGVLLEQYTVPFSPLVNGARFSVRVSVYNGAARPDSLGRLVIPSFWCGDYLLQEFSRFKSVDGNLLCVEHGDCTFTVKF